MHALDDVNGLSIGGDPFDCVVVMTFDDVEEVRSKLMERGVPKHAVQGIL